MRRPTYYDGHTVHLEEVDRHYEDRAALNAVDLRTCVVYEDGLPIVIPVEAIEEFEMTGLSPVEFFRFRMWENGDE